MKAIFKNGREIKIPESLVRKIADHFIKGESLVKFQGITDEKGNVVAIINIEEVCYIYNEHL